MIQIVVRQIIFMPDNMSRIHKIDGENGDLIWTKTIENTVGFGIFEINDDNRVDYLIWRFWFYARTMDV